MEGKNSQVVVVVAGASMKLFLGPSPLLMKKCAQQTHTGTHQQTDGLWAMTFVLQAPFYAELLIAALGLLTFSKRKSTNR